MEIRHSPTGGYCIFHIRHDPLCFQDPREADICTGRPYSSVVRHCGVGRERCCPNQKPQYHQRSIRRRAKDCTHRQETGDEQNANWQGGRDGRSRRSREIFRLGTGCHEMLTQGEIKPASSGANVGALAVTRGEHLRAWVQVEGG